LSGQLEDEASKRQQAEDTARECSDEILSLDTQLSGMCESETGRGGYEADNVWGGRVPCLTSIVMN
jgi:hypothetical protein